VRRSSTVVAVDVVVHRQTVDGWCVLVVAGELDVVGGPQLRQQVHSAVGDGCRRLVLDLSGVSFIDSFGLGVVVGALKRVRQRDGQLEIVVTETRVRRVFEICDLDQVLSLHSTIEQAVG